MQWASLYYFVFEMRKLEDILKSEDLEDKRKRMRCTRMEQIFVWGGFYLVCLPVSLFVFAESLLHWENYKDYIKFYDAILWFHFSVIILMDFIIFRSFIRSFHYFLEQKKIALRLTNSRFTKVNIFVIIFICICTVLYLVSSISSVITFTLKFSSHQSEQIEYFWILSVRTITWTVGFISFMGILYLFHYQSMR
jgi:hypothetical protein